MDFESCQSLEKLVIDAEMIGMARRLLSGIEARDEPIALTLMRKLGHRADYLSEEHTLKWFGKELYLPSTIIDRGSLDAWKRKGAKSAVQRASERVGDLLKRYQPAPGALAARAELRSVVMHAARSFGIETLPPMEGD